MAAPAPRDAKRARPAALEARVSTIELPGLPSVISVLALKGGARFLGTFTALYLYADGRLTLLAGHPSEQGFEDDQGTNSLEQHRLRVLGGGKGPRGVAQLLRVEFPDLRGSRPADRGHGRHFISCILPSCIGRVQFCERVRGRR